jgi:hypothetical protein
VKLAAHRGDLGRAMTSTHALTVNEPCGRCCTVTLRAGGVLGTSGFDQVVLQPHHRPPRDDHHEHGADDQL